MGPQNEGQIPETHERIRDEDIHETLEIFRKGNEILPALPEAHFAWLESALTERKYLCANQFDENGRVRSDILTRLQELDGHINSVSPEILRVLHFLSRIRAIIPVLMDLQTKMKDSAPDDPTQKMVLEMQYKCSRAEVQSAIEGLALLRVRPSILDDVTGQKGAS
ncbi:MAG: hypothetical protein ACOCX4_04475 [Planctomycetota bacterium]